MITKCSIKLAQVLSALVGWSKIEQCTNGGKCNGNKGSDVNSGPHGGNECKYLEEVQPDNKCQDCGCMKYVVIPGTDWAQLGRGCTKCMDTTGNTHRCSCASDCSSGPAEECKCALAGKCCKCCCTSCSGCKNECRCDNGNYIMRYGSTYTMKLTHAYLWTEIEALKEPPTWKHLTDSDEIGATKIGDGLTSSQRRHQCDQILLGSVCLIWSEVTSMHWTGKYAKGSPYWNNHILDGSSLDDGTLSQWLQALGFPRDMLNNSGPQNRLDQVIWDGFMGQLFLGFTHPTGVNPGQSDGTTAKQPYLMNYAGFVHTAHRDSFNTDAATVFTNGNASRTTGQISDTNQHKNGAIFKLYILSCAYFTGLQKKTTHSTTTNNPKTIREILYWLSALPYSQAYKQLLEHAKERLQEVLKKPEGTDKETPTLAFLQQGRSAPITVDEFNLFAHFQAVTQYCPLVLISIQGGLHSTNSTTPAIHVLYANTECGFTYPAVDIQAYNQVVHYIRALFYQLYFLRKQCAVKVTCGGKWRECRYGSGVLGKGVVSWMCLGCNPMEHDRKWRVGKVKKELVGITNGTGKNDTLMKSLVSVLKDIGELVVQLGNAQEVLDRGKEDLTGVKTALNGVFSGVYENGTSGNNFNKVLKDVLGKLETEKVEKLEKESDSVNGLKDAATKATTALTAAATKSGSGSGTDIDQDKNAVSAGIDGLHKVLEAFKQWAEQDGEDIIKQAKSALEHLGKITGVGNEVNLRNVKLEAHYSAFLKAINQLLSLCSSPKCPTCKDHATKCGRRGEQRTCEKCHQQYMDGFPSPLQAFLEDRLPGFSCMEWTLIYHLALGLQKWVGWQEGDTCCLKGEKKIGDSKGIGKGCERGGTATQCCNKSGTDCATHECETCGKGESKNGINGAGKCYLSAYCKKNTSYSGSSTTNLFLWTSISSECTKVHLLARIFLGSVCLIWSGLSQLGFLTGKGSGGKDNRWKNSSLHKIDGTDAGLGSFMAAMGYDLDRLNQGGVPGGEYCLG
ncbi:variant erythrocyte surface antigen-1 alpha subunit [Babesia bovis T2Bo]|uniref:Variant erythrocyte surface antigen-1, alpha subunit n=1 Tax=Babesia bovis TaxID=5865 RepID=A7AMA5_BABBO|nr:variant erythrocyte surface antigen-1 alpha subunit [Babesia bovis T2Bo]EDO07689.1 variant erythrocyte surface antigen-1 alpha subunit [Babesia bovis T2Bo]|eukprot:XP_001611257.1 variant erythrocyte surface antigen-1, alpha subunit [Babesia bovis T2Bo]